MKNAVAGLWKSFPAMKGLIMLLSAVVFCIVAVGSGRVAPGRKEVGPQKATSELAAPALSLSLNCLRDAKIVEGDSLLVEAEVSAAQGEEGAIQSVLSKPGGAWGELVSIEVRDSRSKLVPGLNVRSVIKGDASITLDADHGGWLVWVIESTATAKLPPGGYSVVAILDSPSGGTTEASEDKPSSAPSKLTVVPRSSQLSEDEARIATLAKIRIQTYLSNIEAALASVDAYLAAHPKDGLMLEERGDVLVRANRFGEAIAAYDGALATVPPQPESPFREPAHGVLIKRRMAEEAAKKTS